MCWSDSTGCQGGAGLPSVIDAKKDSDQVAMKLQSDLDGKFFASRAIRKYYITTSRDGIFLVELVSSFIRLLLIIRQLHSTIIINF